jgi:hypothetical protein
MSTDTTALVSHPKRGRPRGSVHDAGIMLRLPGELRDQVFARAQAESMPAAVWIRRAMSAQLRKKPSL